MREQELIRKRRLVTGPDEYGSVYVYFRRPKKNSVAKTVQHQAEVNLEYDEAGNLIGIEILSAYATRRNRRRRMTTNARGSE